jgi:trimeric autotransporter adhesin
MEKQQEQAYLGDEFDLTVKTSKSSEISSSSLQLKIDKNFPVSEVLFSDTFKDSTSSYDDDTGILTLDLVNTGESADIAEAATIKIRVPASTKEGSHLEYELLNGNITYSAPKEENFINTFSMKPVNVPVMAAYHLDHEPILIGKSTLMTVKDNNNEKVSDAEIYAVIEGEGEPTLLGKTDSNGTLRVNSISDEINKITLYAVKEGKYTFKINTQTYSALAGETEFKNIISTPTGNPYQTKGFSWMSSPLTKDKSTVIQFAKKADFERKGATVLKTQQGSATDQIFSGELAIKKNGIVRVNEVVLEKLQQDTTYVYRVGDGEHWSDLKEFTTLKRKQTFDFAVLGDTQSPSDLSHLDKILGELDKKESTFMIHVGDIVDESSKFDQWDHTLGVFSKYKNISSTDLVAALGNHEYMGDGDGSLAKSILNFPENGPDIDKGGTYSVDYNNMHISVLGFTTDNSILDQQLQWLKEDMKKSDKPWKILVTHKPPYYTNPFGGNEIMKEKIPPVADELGIDIVFSGHDHSYGRTKKLKAGKEDSNGTVYVVAGTTGNKHYDAVVDKTFDFVNTDDIAVSMSAHVDKDRITFKTTSSDEDLIDEFTVVNEDYEEE